MPSYGPDTTISTGSFGALGQGGDIGKNDGIPGVKGDSVAAP
jgi:hypothetical protein